MENSELLPCPFCDIYVVETGRGYAVHHRAGCFMGAKGSTYFLPHEIKAWNTRTQPRVTVEEVALWLYNRYEPHPVGWQNQTEMVRQTYLSDAQALKAAHPHLFKE